jgi:sugar phosphate permease
MNTCSPEGLHDNVKKKIDRDKGAFYGVWIVVGCFVLLFLFAGAGFYSFSIFIKPLEEDFGWSRSAISLAMSIYMILHGVAGPFVGHAVETYGPKKVMTLFALLSGAAFVLVSFTSSLWYFYLAYSLLSLSTTGIGFIPVSSVLARWFIRRRGTAIGFAMVGISVGGLVMAPLVGFFISQFGWRMAFVFLGLLAWLLALPVTLFVMKGSPAEVGLLPDGDEPGAGADSDPHVSAARHVGAPSVTEQEGWPLRAAVRTRAFFWIATTFFLGPVAQMGMLQHQAPLLGEAGVSETMANMGVGLTAGLGGLGKLGFGRISEIVPFRYAIMLCFGLQALGVFVLFNAESTAMVWVYVAVFGFAMGGVIVLLPLVVAHFFGLAAFGVLMGTVSLILALGNASGALLSGLIYDSLGSYHYAMIVYMCLYLIAASSIFLAGKPRQYAGPRRISPSGATSRP